jgi:hypothetical protein
VQHIEDKDREILKYKQALKKSEQDYQFLKAETDDLREVLTFTLSVSVTLAPRRTSNDLN